jgi:hypothetical protein
MEREQVRTLAIARTRTMLAHAMRTGIVGAASLSQLLPDTDWYPDTCAEACAHVSASAAMRGHKALTHDATMLHMAWTMLQRGRVAAAHGYLHS